MKKNIFLLSLLATMLVMSCSKESIQEPAPTINDNTTSVAVVDGKLSFANTEQVDSIVNVLLSSDDDMRQAWYDSVGFVSQETLWEKALTEFDQITSADELPGYKERHKATFFFNELTPDDWQPYIPCSKSGYSLIVNAEGDVMINNSVQNFNFTDFTETMYYKSQQAFYASQTLGTKGVNQQINSLYCENGKRKFWAESFRSSNCVWIKFTGQKKGMFGWNHYKEDYCTELKRVSLDTPAGWSHINVQEVSSINNRGPVWVYNLSAGHDVSIGTQALLLYNGSSIKGYYAAVNRGYYIYSGDIGAAYGGELFMSIPALNN